MKIRIATRRSKLSIKQVGLVLSALKTRFPNVNAELIFVKTKGDVYSDLPPVKIGSKGIFEKEVNLAVLRGEADIAVHSLKDVPTQVSEDLTLAAVLPRESPLEALISRGDLRLEELPKGATIGTSSVRRRAALHCIRPDLRIEHLRGNVDTRINKLDAGMFEAILLAEAGLRRLGLGGRITQIFPPEEITPAPCQGAIGVYARRDNAEVLRALREIDDPNTRVEVMVEREVTKRVGGGCFAPLGVLAKASDDAVRVIASLYSPIGRRRLIVKEELPRDRVGELVDRICQRLMKEGEDILSEVKVGSPWRGGW